MPATPLRPSAQIAGIEGLRAIAACAILAVHVWLASSASAAWLSLLAQPMNAGVTLFFTLSGFLLWRPFAAAALRSGEAPHLGRYARNRALRILPAYWTVLLVTALVLSCARLTPLAGSPSNGAITDPALLAKDALLVQNLTPSSVSSGIVSAWSLSIEVAFYALLPLLGLLAVRLARRAPLRRRRRLAALLPAGLLLLLGAIGAILTTYVVPGPTQVFAADWHSVLSWSFLNHADLFAFGMIVAVLRVEHEDGLLALPAWTLPVVDRVLLYAAAPCLFVGYFLLTPTIRDFTIAALTALLLARIVLVPATARPAHLVRILESRVLVAIGLASYSVFLWNFPITVFLADHGFLLGADAAWAFALNLAIVGFTVALLAALTYRLVEQPAMRIARNRRRSARQALTTARRAT